MRTVEVGSLLIDNDPRMIGRVLVVDSISTLSHHVRVFCHNKDDPALRTGIRLDRIHTDGKPRRSGFSLIYTGPQP